MTRQEVQELDRERQRIVITGRTIGLAAREAAVVALLWEEYSDKEVAAKMKVSRHTVRSFIRQILRKLAVKGRTGAAVRWERALAAGRHAAGLGHSTTQP